jgi:hypothetical protein
MARGRALSTTLVPRRGVITTAFAALVALVILGPMLLPGFPLRYDLVSVPRPVLGDDALGLGDRLPRAVPLDVVTAVLAKVLPDAWLTQFLALLALILAGTGAARLAAMPLPGRLVAAFAAEWNPFVMEQLGIGHVPHLLAYAAAPWAGWAGWCVTSGGRLRRHWAVLVLATALGALTPGGGLLVALAALAGLLAGRWSAGKTATPRRSWVLVLAGFVPVALLQLPWLVAAAMAPGLLAGGDQDAMTAFALRGETGWGRLLDALGLSGMWNATAVPSSRATVLAQVSTVLVIGLAAGGIPRLSGLVRRRPELGPAVVAGGVACLICYFVAILPILPGGDGMLRALVAAVPGAGLLRDGHRWLALPAMGFAVLSGHAVTGLSGQIAIRASRRAPGSAGAIRAAWRWSTAALTGILLIAAMPDLGLGLSGRLRAWHYPPQWAAVRAHLDAAPDSARVLILPWQPFRTFAWTGGLSAVLDPAARLLPRQTVVSDALPVSGATLPAEGPGARAMTIDLADNRLTDAELSNLAIGWILVERGTPGRVPVIPGGWTLAAGGSDLQLWRAPGVLPKAPRPSATRAVGVIGSHLLFGGLVLAALLALTRSATGGAMRQRQRRTTIGDRQRLIARD